MPILLPFELYSSIKEVILRERLIYTSYVNDGKKPFNSKYSSFYLFQLALNQYEKLKTEALKFVSQHQNDKLACRRKEIDWLISNNKSGIVDDIAQNNGMYSEKTLKFIFSPSFIDENKKIFLSKHTQSVLDIKFDNDRNMVVIQTIPKTKYNPPLTFRMTYETFMRNFGSKCIMNKEYYYDDKSLLGLAAIVISESNLISVINYTYNIMQELDCVFLIDSQTNGLILYRKSDRAIRNFNIKAFLGGYVEFSLLRDGHIKNYLKNTVYSKSAKWIDFVTQKKYGNSEKIARLYKEQI